jgi:hypothetical protein
MSEDFLMRCVIIVWKKNPDGCYRWHTISRSTEAVITAGVWPLLAWQIVMKQLWNLREHSSKTFLRNRTQAIISSAVCMSSHWAVPLIVSALLTRTKACWSRPYKGSIFFFRFRYTPKIRSCIDSVLTKVSGENAGTQPNSWKLSVIYIGRH